jgi:hypothetical protein
MCVCVACPRDSLPQFSHLKGAERGHVDICRFNSTDLFYVKFLLISCALKASEMLHSKIGTLGDYLWFAKLVLLERMF